MIRSRDVLVSGVLAALLLAGAPPPKPSRQAEEPEEESPTVAKARGLFMKGVDLVKKAQWSDALAAFEQSAKLKPHATTTFNIGACERAMGRYTRARMHFKAALARNKSNPGELAGSLQDEAKGFVKEIDDLLARVDVVLKPSTAAIAVDGRPLAKMQSGSTSVYVGGIKEPGRGTVLGPSKFRVELNPGAHVITLSRKGYTDAVVNRTFAPGSTAKLDLVLDRLPAKLDISSNIPGAIVTVNGHDFGPVPVDLKRPAGTYKVVVKKDGYEPYEAKITVQAGEQSNLRGRLVPEKVPITKRWWFWTAAGVVLAGGALTTYALTRPSPQPPPYDGGSTGWVVKASGFHF